FITLPAFPVFGNQIARFSEWAAHLTLSVVRQKGRNRKKSQSKMDQNFGRNRKTVEKGGYCLFFCLQKVQNLRVLNHNTEVLFFFINTLL
ncbi:hypothetical protein, partial [uncultured Parabacteroides sp.]|uniref:hypothetical protein n=1 Tax=uncultured Parabacteroides sp. TaxID=512312 RepID=UPI00258A44B6